jgi:hypothetical protein
MFKETRSSIELSALTVGTNFVKLFVNLLFVPLLILMAFVIDIVRMCGLEQNGNEKKNVDVGEGR